MSLVLVTHSSPPPANQPAKEEPNFLAQPAQQATSENDVENLASSFIDIYRKHKTRHCLEPLRLIYYRMNCGIHRCDVVETLLDNGVLPDEIREEIVFYSFDDTRELLNRA